MHDDEGSKSSKRVVNVRHEQTFDVYIGRRIGAYVLSKWANPIKLGHESQRVEVLMQYAAWLKTQQHLMDSVSELRGKVLGCWCSPKDCHGDILARLAESIDPYAEIDTIMSELGDRLPEEA